MFFRNASIKKKIEIYENYFFGQWEHSCQRKRILDLLAYEQAPQVGYRV